MILLIPFLILAAAGWTAWKVAKWTAVLIIAMIVAATVVAVAVAREVRRYVQSL